jgi:hypothetical protein
VWATGANATQATACDLYGNCSTVSSSVPAESIPAQQNAPVIISPLAGDFVQGAAAMDVQGAAVNSVQVNVQVAAAAPAGLKEIVILANGQALKTLSYAQADHVTEKVETVTVSLPGEGQYALTVQSTDWDGNVQTNAAPPTFSLDGQAPTVALLTDVLTDADSVGNGVLRFYGTASDSMGLATVQIQVNGGPFQDVTLHDDGTWTTALYLGPDSYGKTYQITVQAIDKAGRQASVSKAVLVNIVAPVEVDPLPTPTPIPGATATPAPGATATPTATPISSGTGKRNVYLPMVRR